jgi:hypothetical protein
MKYNVIFRIWYSVPVPYISPQAIANTGVQEGFSIVRTRDQRGSVEHLALFTRILENKYRGLTLTSCTQVDISISWLMCLYSDKSGFFLTLRKRYSLGWLCLICRVLLLCCVLCYFSGIKVLPLPLRHKFGDGKSCLSRLATIVAIGL